jgi:phenylalanyl-tRNA synthetase beta chain
MRVPRSWLRELVDVDVPTDELAATLSHAGVAVDAVETFAEGVGGIYVGRVLEVSDVPESKKLVIAQVDVGPKGKVQVLVGAKNFSAGDKVPVALPGARVTTLDVPVGKRTMLGTYESNGMLCSAREMGISDDHGGIAVLPDAYELGDDVAALLGLGDDVLEFEIYPNRPDCMSVQGIAREVALLYRTELKVPDATVVEGGSSAAEITSVTIEAPDACPRYLARVIEGVTFGPSPLLVQARLTACGFRPLGNLVDATNYVLLLTGQPLHAFDLDKLDEGRIVVRRAKARETITTLDGTARALTTNDLVIADANKAQAIAGVMGGAGSEVGPSTTRVLVESAYFDPTTISRTARGMHMHTEASSRFERGTDPEAVPTAAAIAAECTRRWAGGTVANGAVDAGRAPERRRVTLRPERLEAILGIEVPGADVDRFFAGLGLDASRTDQGWRAVVPSWRPDLEREIDLVEEVARLYGYEKIPPRPRVGIGGDRSVSQKLRERVRDVFTGAGATEVTLSTFISEQDVAAFGYEGDLVRVANPMTVEQRQLRPTLMAGLMRAAQRNLDHGVGCVRIFEFGRIFTGWPADAELPDESEHVAMLLAGEAGGDDWLGSKRSFDAYDVKGAIELVLSAVGVEGWRIEPDAGMPFHPGRSARVMAGDTYIGRFGEIRPSVSRAFGIEGAVVAGGFVCDALFSLAPSELKVHALPTQPPVVRDITMAVADDVPAAEIEATIEASAGTFLERVLLVDEYRGEQVGEGRRSLSFRVWLRAPDRTLTAAEADEARAAVVAALRDAHGAEIR